MQIPGLGSSPLTRGKPTPGGNRTGRAGLIPAHAGKTADLLQVDIQVSAHPRSRGENSFRAWCWFPVWGSSPLTRGKLPHRPQEVQAAGLIPAHAGKTGRGDGGGVGEGAHPRSRGENAHSRSRYANDGGSSPLTRGKPLRSSTDRDKRAHPRSRGENLLFDNVGKDIPGSSPLTRGKQEGQVTTYTDPGLIPAHAGKTPAQRGYRWCSWAHPRSRGENAPNGIKNFADGGSSPLTRGKHRGAPSSSQSPGLIPAHAGKTEMAPLRQTRCTAHPRSRGENKVPT